MIRSISINTRPSGLSLIEVMIAMAITSVILVATTQALIASQRAIRLAALEADMSATALMILDRIANDLKEAVKTTVSPPNSTSTVSQLTFQKCMGYTASGMLLSQPITYEGVYIGARADSSDSMSSATGGLNLMATDVDNITDVWAIRRTESGQSEDLTNRLAPPVGSAIPGLGFTMDNTLAKDVYFIQVQLIKSDFLVVRSTRVQLKF